LRIVFEYQYSEVTGNSLDNRVEKFSRNEERESIKDRFLNKSIRSACKR